MTRTGRPVKLLGRPARRSRRISPRGCSTVRPAGRRRVGQPTPSATRSRLPASRSRTPLTDRSGACRVPGNSQRKGAIKKTGKGNPTAGSGGRVRRGLEGKEPRPRRRTGRTTRPTRRRPVTRRSPAAARVARWAKGGGDHQSGSRGGTPSSRHCVRAARHLGVARRGPARQSGCARSSRSRPTRASPCSRCPTSSSTG